MDQVKCHPHEGHSSRRRWRLPRPITRFVGWWASVFALVGPFSVYPFCGQPGCGMGGSGGRRVGRPCGGVDDIPQVPQATGDAASLR